MMRPLIVAFLAACGVFAQTDSVPSTRSAPTPQAAAEAVLGPSVTKRESAVKWALEHPETHPAIAERLRAMGPELHFDGVRALGRLRFPEITAALRNVVMSPTFAWKPMALEALADHADPESAVFFSAALASPVARSRAAGIRGLAALGAFEEVPDNARLSDDDEAAVRLEYARAAFDFDPKRAVVVACRDLTLDRKFGDFDPGKVARTAASDWLKSLGGSVPSVDRALDATAAATVAAQVLKARGASLEAPPTIVAHAPDVEAPTTLIEVRSCIEGDLFLRVAPDGRLVFGRDALRTFRVEPSLAVAVIDAVAALDLGSKGRRILGPVNCDFIRIGRGGATPGSLLVGTGKGDAAVLRVHTAVVFAIASAVGSEAAAAQARRAGPFLPKS
jgi:hypothetical protein